MGKGAVARREVLAGLAAALAPLSGLVPRRAVASSPAPARYLSARADAGGRFHATVFSERGEAVLDLPLPARGHGAAFSALRGEMMVFGRRPGNYAVVFSDRGPVGTIEPAPGRWFSGHGFCSPDGDLLYAVEESREGGAIGVYDTTRSYARTGEFSTGGIGPHQAVLLPDARTIAVCNGGILTDPDFPRAKLNLATMEPSLVLIDRSGGRIMATARFPKDLHRLSIRHLDVAADGALALGLQYEGPRGDPVPLVAVCRGEGLVPLEMGAEARLALRQYVGSIAFDATGRTIAATSPVGGAVAFWEAAGGRFRGSIPLADVCGLASVPSPESFLVTTGLGAIHRVQANGASVVTMNAPFGPGGAWDNHLLRLPATTT